MTFFWLAGGEGKGRDGTVTSRSRWQNRPRMIFSTDDYDHSSVRIRIRILRLGWVGSMYDATDMISEQIADATTNEYL